MNVYMFVYISDHWRDAVFFSSIGISVPTSPRQNADTSWVSVDINGDVFYSDATTKTINRRGLLDGVKQSLL